MSPASSTSKPALAPGAAAAGGGGGVHIGGGGAAAAADTATSAVSSGVVVFDFEVSVVATGAPLARACLSGCHVVRLSP